MSYVHEMGYCHRDLKPENVMMDHSKKVKLIDFGFAAQIPDLKTKQLQTCCGSDAYAAPEVLRQDEYDGQAADVWSLGVLLYAILCGALPFDDDRWDSWAAVKPGTCDDLAVSLSCSLLA